LGDAVNAFTGESLTDAQKNMQSYLKKILNYRKHSAAIHNGKTRHFAPQDGVYVLFRIDAEETVVHIMNKNENTLELDLARFKEVELNQKPLTNIITGAVVVWNTTLELNGKGSILLTTKTNF